MAIKRPKQGQVKKTRELLLHTYKKTGKPIGVEGTGFTRIFRRIGKKHGLSTNKVRKIATELEKNMEIKLIRSNHGGYWPMEKRTRDIIELLAINPNQFYTPKLLKEHLNKKRVTSPKNNRTIVNILSAARAERGLGIVGLRLIIMRKYEMAGKAEQMRRMAVTNDSSCQRYKARDRKVSIELQRRKTQLQKSRVSEINEDVLYEEIVKEMFPPRGTLF